MILIRSRRPWLVTALSGTSILAVVTIASRLLLLSVVDGPWLKALFVVELVVVGNALLLGSIAAHWRSERAHDAMSALYVLVIVHASLWLLAMMAYLVWERPDCAGSEGDGAFELLGVLAIGVRTMWMLGKIAFALWGRATLRSAGAAVEGPVVF